MAAEHNGLNGHITYLTADAILAAADVRETDVSVPEWGGTVRLRALTVAAQEDITRQAAEHGPGARPGQVDNDKMQALLVIHSVVDPTTHKPLFRPAQLEALRAKSFAALGRVVRAVLELNGMTEGAAAQAEARFPTGAGEATPVLSGA